jgi:hypothetical protein
MNVNAITDVLLQFVAAFAVYSLGLRVIRKVIAAALEGDGDDSSSD